MASLPCTRCLQIAAGNPDAVVPVVCQYVEGSSCSYCSNHYQKAPCQKVPQSLVRLAEHIQRQLARRREDKDLVSAEEIMSLWRVFFTRFCTWQRENGISSILLADGTIAEDEGFGNFELPTSDVEAVPDDEILGEETDNDDDDQNQGVRAPDDLYITTEGSNGEGEAPPSSRSVQQIPFTNGTHHQAMEVCHEVPSDDEERDLGVRAPDDLYITPEGSDDESFVSCKDSITSKTTQESTALPSVPVMDQLMETHHKVHSHAVDNHNLNEAHNIAGYITQLPSHKKASVFPGIDAAPSHLMATLEG
ncbi:hypothetical protein FQN54_005074 [Arachnomyces sp. PD_36]|nr:hypothetical protein FQN54_005074 [Arachnomyces sp. PD_36]